MKEKIFNDVERLGKARVDFINSVRDFADQIVDVARSNEGSYLYLGRSGDKEYFVEPRYSRVGAGEWFLFVRDARSERSLNDSRLGGGYFYLHQDFNTRIERANYADCLEFVAYMRDKFGDYVEDCLKRLSEKMTFFK